MVAGCLTLPPLKGRGFDFSEFFETDKLIRHYAG
jgi:hypothetical protein